MPALPNPGLAVVECFGVAPETLAHALVLYGLNGLFYGFVARTILIALGRAFGLCAPSFYSYWPRLPWRSVLLVWFKFAAWRERVFIMGKRATGGFASALYVLTRLYKPGQVLLGRASAWGIGLLQPVGTTLARHGFIYAATGAGKTTALISMVATWCGSAVLIDPKGQIVRALGAHDRLRRWIRLAPYDASTAIFNVFDDIKAAIARFGPDAAVLWAQRVAQALVITPAGSRQPYFTDVARAFLSGLILYVLVRYPESQHNLATVRDLIVHGLRVFNDDGSEATKGDEAFGLLAQEMKRCTEFEGAIAGAAAAMTSAGGETGGNVRSTLQDQTKVLDIPGVRRMVTGTSTLSLSELKTRDDRVLAFDAPVNSIREELAPLGRLLINMVGYTFEAVKQRSRHPCLLCVDELPSLGYNEAFEVMLPVARGYGLFVVGIAQNIELMRKTYPKSWASFSGESDFTMWMATNHDETAEHVSKVLGQRTLVEVDRQSGRKSYRDVAVMTADQVKRYLNTDSGNLIVTRNGGRALRLKIEPYFKVLPVWRYAADPDHKEAPLRRLARLIADPVARKARGSA